jgi:hypothetical protein
MTKIAGSGSGSGFSSQRHGSADPDPDPHQNVMDPQHWFGFKYIKYRLLTHKSNSICMLLDIGRWNKEEKLRQCCGSEAGVFLTSGSGIGFSRILDPYFSDFVIFVATKKVG